ncbi:AB hydrolase-1 domain-containing protein [Meloidogyne graminicola]|uniref:sn-1-specific diacylglycerol lipase ABHD11 n=1 Tax=Meloidogyne graminicola TaxID=189291 RepID=A0A8S9ZQ68_9BILA|nr:AB hydrolase-1 domain-containing protein [Meloidogyne graminicola]
MVFYTLKLFLPQLTFNFTSKRLSRSFCSTKNFQNSQTEQQQPSTVNLSFDLHLETFKRNEGKIEATNPLVITHGIFGHKQNWRSIAKALQRELDNYVFVVDMRNHGESPHVPECSYSLMAADLREFIEKEVLSRSRFKNVFLLGHSMGGKVVSEFGLQDSQTPLLEKLIIEDIAPHRSTTSSLNNHEYIKALKSLDLHKTRTELDRELRKQIVNADIRAFLLTNLYKPRGGRFHWRCNLSALESNLNHLINYKLETNLKQKCPTLFVSGKKSDYLIVERDREEILKIFPKAEFVEIGGAGHWVHSERPAQFIQHVVNFLKKGYFIYEQ